MALRGIYLAAYKARHSNFDLDYNDVDKSTNCNIICDMLEVDLSKYDYVIATPPCNWWSRINYRNYRSEYALMTRHLLPVILLRLSKLGKPFIVENVSNDKRYRENGIFRICQEQHIRYVTVGRHIYFTNTDYDLNCCQHFDFRNGGYRVNNDGHNQGGSNVHNVIDKWLLQLHGGNLHENK